jgi:anti-sigma regulatory factor (Ser/Thr protein kinase)
MDGEQTKNTDMAVAESNTAKNPYTGATSSMETKNKAASDKAVRISITLPTSAYFMSGLRDFTMNVVRNMTGFSQQWSFRMQSVVDELVNNAIEYGSAPGTDVKVTFVSQKDKAIEIFVEDTGTGPSKKNARDMTAFIEEKRYLDPTKITSLRGRGLSQIVANWTDVLEFKDNSTGGLTVHVAKFLDKDDQN